MASYNFYAFKKTWLVKIFKQENIIWILISWFKMFVKLPTCVCCWQPDGELSNQVHLCHSTYFGNRKEVPRTVASHFQLRYEEVSSR